MRIHHGRKLWHFHGGLRLAAHKRESTTELVTPAGLPPRLTLPLQQHIGEAATPLVEPGDKVLKGQKLAAAEGYVSVPLHAPTSGTVVEIKELPVPHPSGLRAPCIIIESDGEDRWIERHSISNYREMDRSALRNLIRDAGIVGLGGAGFPSFIKLNAGPRMQIDTLIVNGAECEPYISCDDMLMRERPREILDGVRIMRHVLNARHCILGIEDNKPTAYRALYDALDGDDEIEIVRVPTIYPAGGEKQLIKTLTGKEVPSHGLPLDIGVVCHNVGTADAVYRAVAHGEPLISRYVTVAGSAVGKPRNLEALIGTPMADLLASCDAEMDAIGRLVMGGPMMGILLHDPGLPAIKTTNCILATHVSEVKPAQPALPCIRCGECARVCPASLLPQELYWYAHARDFDKIQDYNLFDCIECGCCAYACPSNIPLVQYYRFAKTGIWEQEREKQKSDRARRRHEFREMRLEREKRERAARRERKKAALAAASDQSDTTDPKKAAILAALERTRAKKATSGAEPRDTDNRTEREEEAFGETVQRNADAPKRAAADEDGPDQ